MFKSVRCLNVVLLFFFETKKGHPSERCPFFAAVRPTRPHGMRASSEGDVDHRQTNLGYLSHPELAALLHREHIVSFGHGHAEAERGG